MLDVWFVGVDSYSLGTYARRFASLRFVFAGFEWVRFASYSLRFRFASMRIRRYFAEVDTSYSSISLAPLALRRLDRYFVDSLRYSSEARRFAEDSQGSAGEAFELRGGAETYYSTINLQS